MSKTNQTDRKNLIKRELKIDDNQKGTKDFREVDEYLKTVSKKFMKEPLTIENLDKVYTDMVSKGKVDRMDKNE